MSNNQKPVGRVSLYPISAAIWRNENAKGQPFYSVTVQRNYKTAEGEWRSTESLNEDDLLLAAKVLDLAHTEVVKIRAQDRSSQAPDEQAA